MAAIAPAAAASRHTTSRDFSDGHGWARTSDLSRVKKSALAARKSEIAVANRLAAGPDCRILRIFPAVLARNRGLRPFRGPSARRGEPRGSALTRGGRGAGAGILGGDVWSREAP
jgi:hypothetical protein